jgi:hypothetical protein
MANVISRNRGRRSLLVACVRVYHARMGWSTRTTTSLGDGLRGRQGYRIWRPHDLTSPRKDVPRCVDTSRFCSRSPASGSLFSPDNAWGASPGLNHRRGQRRLGRRAARRYCRNRKSRPFRKNPRCGHRWAPGSTRSLTSAPECTSSLPTLPGFSTVKREGVEITGAFRRVREPGDARRRP